jgi:hypothetical protein
MSTLQRSWYDPYLSLFSCILTLVSLFSFLHFFMEISDSGEMCAMKEVTIFSDDPKSKESQKQLSQVNVNTLKI